MGQTIADRQLATIAKCDAINAARRWTVVYTYRDGGHTWRVDFPWQWRATVDEETRAREWMETFKPFAVVEYCGLTSGLPAVWRELQAIEE